MWIEKNIVIINKCRGFHLITDEIEKKVPDKKLIGATKKLENVLCESQELKIIPTKHPKHEKNIITKNR